MKTLDDALMIIAILLLPLVFMVVFGKPRVDVQLLPGFMN